MPPTKLGKIGKRPVVSQLRHYQAAPCIFAQAPLGTRPLRHRPANRTLSPCTRDWSSIRSLLLIGMIAVRRLPVLLMIAATLAVSAGAAEAATCYVLFDRYDNVVYRNTVSPIDLS